MNLFFYKTGWQSGKVYNWTLVFLHKKTAHKADIRDQDRLTTLKIYAKLGLNFNNNASVFVRINYIIILHLFFTNYVPFHTIHWKLIQQLNLFNSTLNTDISLEFITRSFYANVARWITGFLSSTSQILVIRQASVYIVIQIFIWW